jgi:hypothetical protein
MASKWQQLMVFLAIAVSAICVLVPLAAAQSGHVQVSSKPGSSHLREHTLNSGYVVGLVPSRLGSPDPRDTAFEQAGNEHSSAGYGNYPG